MFTKRKTIRFIAVFLLLNFIFDLAIPSISWALTSGPTTPEVSTFEPFETTDLVNLSSGDFVYNIPLLEVPGPAGGFPISLSYHAGIMPNQEASWVGLGWNLNPGVINRTVSGIPDDHRNITSTIRNYWSGGTTDIYNYGVNIGIYGGPHISAGVQVAHDTYKGTGVGFSVGVSGRFGGEQSGIGGNASIGTSPYGGVYASAGLSAGISLGSNLAASVGIGGSIHSISGASGYVAGGVSIGDRNAKGKERSQSLMGGSLSVGGGKFNASGSVGGARMSNTNSKGGRVSESTSNFGIEVPVWYGISLSFSKQRRRYWIDETEKISNNGSIYFPTSNDIDLDKSQFDVYSMSRRLDDHFEPKDALLHNFGTFPDYDHYQVMGQGISGNIQPFHYRKNLIRRNVFDITNNGEEDERTSKTIQRELFDDHSPNFRFVNDFSNKLLSHAEDEGAELISQEISFQFDDSPESFHFEGDENPLPGSRNVKAFTLEEISSGTAPLLPTTSSGYDIQIDENLQSSIGGFLITNESGVKYHFALPAYEKEEYQYSENIESVRSEEGTKYNQLKNPDPYAYAWHLTAITGPDYVDRSPMGLGEEDWGYWVELNYGRWTENYVWRNPSKGFHVDLDEDFHNYSTGKKELYYLDYIRTKTHTALFVKSQRDDSKSLAVPKNILQRTDQDFIPSIDAETGLFAYPVSALKLESILLVKNGVLNQVMIENGHRSINDIKAKSSNFTNGGIGDNLRVIHEAKNVLLSDDLTSLSTSLIERALKVISLTSNYSLVDQTENSFNHPLLYTSTPETKKSAYNKGGKLTLRAINYRGKGGYSIIPPIVFGYEVNSPKSGYFVAQNLEDREIQFADNNFGLIEGDLLKIDGDKGRFNAVILRQESNGDYVAVLTGGDRDINDYSGRYNWEITKNPVFDKDAYTSWMQFKPDYYHTEWDKLDKIRRYTSEITSKSVDVWSLRQITSSTGGIINVEYECDSYKTTAYPNNVSFGIIDHQVLDINENIIQFNIDTDVLNLAKLTNGSLFNHNFELWFPITEEFIPGSNCSLNDLENQGHQLIGQPWHILRINSSGAEFTVNRDNIIVDLDDDLAIFRDSDYYDYGVSCNDMTLHYQYYGGNLVLLDPIIRYGGGLRTSSIAVKDPLLGKTNKTIYEYNNPTTGESSGTTSYEPGVINEPNVSGTFVYDQPGGGTIDAAEEYITSFREHHIWDANEFSRFVPSPGILYEYVTMRDETIHQSGHVENVGGSSRYNFQIYEEGMVQMITNNSELDNTPVNVTLDENYKPPVDPDNLFPNDIHVKEKSIVDYSIKNYTTGVGGLKAVTLIDKNGSKISETRYDFLSDTNDKSYGSDFEQQIADNFNNLGVIHESFSEQRYVKDGDDYKEYGIFSKLETYPSIQIKETNINYKTGVETSITNLEFDHFSGAPIKTLSSDSYGNRYVTEKVPAYHSYPSMNPIGIGNGNNMLIQECANYVYQVNDEYFNDPVDENIESLLSASVQTWSDQIPVLNHANIPDVQSEQSGILRKHKNYVWKGDDISLPIDGLYPFNQFERFTSWTAEPQNSQWEKQSEVTLVDVWSHALEAKDINKQYAATKLDNNQERVIATIANARYEEFAFTGFEEFVDATLVDGIALGNDATLVNRTSETDYISTHTGKFAVRSEGIGDKAFELTIDLTNNNHDYYRASIWTNSPGGKIYYSLDGISGQQGITSEGMKAGSWYLVNLDIPVAGSNSLTVWCESSAVNTDFDDFRIHPLDAAMTSYVYNEWGELTHILNASNFYMEYKYDQMGRLEEVWEETIELSVGRARISFHKIHYARQK